MSNAFTSNRIQSITMLAIVFALLGISGANGLAADLPQLSFENGRVSVRTPDNQQVMIFGQFRVPWTPGTRFDVQSFQPVANEPDMWELTYKTIYPKENAIEPLTLTAQVQINNPKLMTVTYHLKSESLNLDDHAKWLSGAMAQMQFPKEASDKQIDYLANWTRHEYGGVPFEVAQGTLYYYDTKTLRIGILADKSNPNWSDASSQHLGATRVDEHHYTFGFKLILSTPQTPCNAIGSLLAGRPLSVKVLVDQPYNWFPVSDTPAKASVKINNVTAVSQSFETEISVRDFDGRIVYDFSERLNLPAFGSRDIPVNLPAKQRNLYFVEASVHENHFEVFDRTNIAVVPDFEFKQDGKTSIFGIAAAWPLPTQQDMLRLLKRMGVRHTRSTILPEPTDFPDWLQCNLHSNMRAKINPTDEEKKDIEENIRKMLAKADQFNCDHFEFCNEWNMSQGIGKAYLAPTYVENYLTVLDNIRKQTNSSVKITMVGLAGMDSGFLKKMYELGAWDKFDILNLHPGRGNYTADYDPNGPGMVDSHGDYWNFYGALRTMKRLSKQFGEKPIILSEVYACTYPNNFWEDTIRNAAENVVLTCALSQAEGVQRIFWYQLQDSVWWKRGGVRHTDREFYFGLLNRDLSFKPSIMSYMNIAETLDQATFVKHLTFTEDDKAKGLLYDTPRGKVAILWHRADGYILTQKAEHYASPEPWVDTWKTKVPMTFTTTGDTVITADAIGRRKTITANDHKVQLILDGAPLVVTGLQFE